LPEIGKAVGGFGNQTEIEISPQDPEDGKNVIVELRAGTAARKRHCSPADLLSYVFQVCRKARLENRRHEFQRTPV